MLVGIVVLLVFVLFPSVGNARKKARQIDCSDNLKQVGLAFRLASETDPRYPMRWPTNEGGTLEVSTDVWRTFLIMSNELGSPGVLICQSDNRNAAASWSSLANSNISYFIGLDADESLPQTILSGDRNLTKSKPLANRVLTVTSNEVVVWTGAMHDGSGNILLSDGSVQNMTLTPLNSQIGKGLISLTESHRYLTNKPPAMLRLAMPE